MSINLKRLWKKYSPAKLKQTKRYKSTVSFLQKRPFMSFFLALGILLALIIVGNLVAGFSKPEEKEVHHKKSIEVYSIGEIPTVTLQGRVKQEGIVDIVAQTSGIVQSITIPSGKQIYKGQQILSLSSNYQGGNAAGLQAQIAGAQHKNIKDTYDAQKELIAKQKDLAERSLNNTEELRKISESARNENSTLLNLNEQILTALENQLQSLQAGGGTPEQIAQAQQLRIQALSGVNQLRSAQRNLDYQTDTENPPTALANIQKDIAIKQLDIQGKALDLSREVSGLQYNLALIQASLMAPASPFTGTVEKIHVTIGQSVTPGTVLATVSSNNQTGSLIVLAPKEIANGVSLVEQSKIHIGRKTINVVPVYVSSVPTDGQLYTILFDLPEDAISSIANKSYVSVEIPVGYANTTSVTPFVPVDSVYQSQDSAYVYVASNGKAESREITVGKVYGNFVEVLEGIKKGDKLILNRNIVAGDEIEISQ